MTGTGGVQRIDGRPSLAGRVKKFDARKRMAVAIIATCDQHLAIRQRCCRVMLTRRAQYAGIDPNTTTWVEEFGAVCYSSAAGSADDNHLPI